MDTYLPYSGLSTDDIWKVAGYLEGTCASVETPLELYELEADPEEVENDLELLCNLERCSFCDWWFNAGELIDEDGEYVGCEQCREE